MAPNPNQPDLFDAPDPFSPGGPGVRITDPETSWLAAYKTPWLRAHDRWNVLLAHAAHRGGLTDFELGDIVGRQQTSAGKRRGELRDNGLIEATDLKRNAPSGSPAIVWRITAAGLRATMDAK
jgi:hypothetical protein